MAESSIKEPPMWFTWAVHGKFLAEIFKKISKVYMVSAWAVQMLYGIQPWIFWGIYQTGLVTQGVNLEIACFVTPVP